MKSFSKIFLCALFTICFKITGMEQVNSFKRIELTDLPIKILYVCVQPAIPSLVPLDNYKKLIKEFHSNLTPLILCCKKFSTYREKLTKKFIAQLSPGICMSILSALPQEELAATKFLSILLLLNKTNQARKLLTTNFTKFFVQIMLSGSLQDIGELPLKTVNRMLLQSSSTHEFSYQQSEVSNNLIALPQEVLFKIFLELVDPEQPKESFLTILALTQSSKQFFHFRKLLIYKLRNLMAKNVLAEKCLESLTSGQTNLCYLLLLSGHVNINYIYPSFDHGTLLIIATNYTLKHIARLLITLGAPVNAKDELGRDALCFSIIRRMENVAHLLIKKNANIHNKYFLGNTSALILAVTYNLHAVAQALIDKGIDIDAKNSRGQTALDIALTAKEEKLVNILLNANRKERKNA